MNVLGLLLAAVLLFLGGRYFYGRYRQGRMRRAVHALRAQCGGDQALVERLIFAEMQKDESLDITSAARRARLRLERDRH